MPTLLHVLIEASGLSRRRAFAAIREGRVTVGGRVLVDPSAPHQGGTIAIDGQPLGASSGKKVYLLLNKPAGFVSTTSDERGRATVLDLVPVGLRVPGLHPVGRLDLDTSGLLILTNDGDLTFALTHPSHEVEKEYWLRLRHPATDEQLAALRAGVEIDGQRRRPIRLSRLENAQPFQLTMTIREGRKRQVRRMFEAVEARVTRLERVREGPLSLDALPEGAVRPLTPSEVERLLTGSPPRRKA